MPVWIAHLLLWLVGMLPALLAVAALPPTTFDSVPSVLNALGRLTGIAGLGLMLVTAIVSFRIPGFDRLFGGLTTLWRSHHLMGGVSFLLLLAHPLLLAVAAAETSLAGAVAVLLPATGGAAIWLGWGALVLMMVFLAPSFSFFGPPHYQRWKHLHKLSGIAAVLALVHTFLLARTLPEPWSSVVWATLALAAMAALVYGLVLGRRANQYRYQVAEVACPANNVVEIRLSPQGKPLSYQAGQFVYLTCFDPGLGAGHGEEHPYTLSSAPGEADLRIAIKDLGDASRAIRDITVGSEARVTGPYGAFFPGHDSDRELWIAGGVGITPFLGRARHLATLGRAVDMHLVYCVQDEARAVFLQELQELCQRVTGLSLTMHYFYRDGPLNGEFLRQHCPDFAQRQAYVCGPGALNGVARQVLIRNGLPRANYHSEEFNLL